MSKWRTRLDGDGIFGGSKGAKNARSQTAFEKERDRIRALNDEKTTRLRELRLAKEAAEKALEKTLVAHQTTKPKAKAKAKPVL